MLLWQQQCLNKHCVCPGDMAFLSKPSELIQCNLICSSWAEFINLMALNSFHHDGWRRVERRRRQLLIKKWLHSLSLGTWGTTSLIFHLHGAVNVLISLLRSPLESSNGTEIINFLSGYEVENNNKIRWSTSLIIYFPSFTKTYIYICVYMVYTKWLSVLSNGTGRIAKGWILMAQLCYICITTGVTISRCGIQFRWSVQWNQVECGSEASEPWSTRVRRCSG